MNKRLSIGFGLMKKGCVIEYSKRNRKKLKKSCNRENKNIKRKSHEAKKAPAKFGIFGNESVIYIWMPFPL